MLKSYLRYIWRRKNAFHIHSPFVYRLYTEVIEAHNEASLRKLGIERKETVPVGELLERYLADRSEGTMWVAKDIHQNRNNEAVWNTICAHPDVTLTIDLFREGWVFYREGMEKQDFVLRS